MEGVVSLGRVRLIVPTGRGHVHSLARHVRALQEEGRKVVFVSTDRPYASLVQSLASGGVNVDNIHFVDAVSSINGAAPSIRPPNTTFLPSPTMLEMLAMRVEQTAQRLGPGTHMVLDSLDTLSLYNGVQPVQEFSHYLANRLRAQGVHGDFVVRESPSRNLHDLVVSFSDERVDLKGEDS